MKIIAAVAVLLATVILPRSAAAQAPFPGAVNIDGGWVPCSHKIAIDRGLGCYTTPAAPEPPTQLDADCQSLNPYSDPEKAAECARRPIPGSSTPVFLIGHVYAHGYSSQKARVLGISQDTAGLQVVTFEWLPESGNEGVTAQRTPPAPGGASNWVYVGRSSPM
jgi:hypothetical protein